jgi:hypothetical protein
VADLLEAVLTDALDAARLFAALEIKRDRGFVDLREALLGEILVNLRGRLPIRAQVLNNIM